MSSSVHSRALPGIYQYVRHWLLLVSTAAVDAPHRSHTGMLQRHPCAAVTAAATAEQDVREEEVDENSEKGVEHDPIIQTEHRPSKQQIMDETDTEERRGTRPLLSSFDEYLDNPPSCRPWPEARQECPQCRRRGRFYCSDCLVFVGTPDGVDVPTGLRLPLEVSCVSCPAWVPKRTGLIFISVMMCDIIYLVLRSMMRVGSTALPGTSARHVKQYQYTKVCWVWYTYTRVTFNFLRYGT